MRHWVEEKTLDGCETHTLLFEHHSLEEKMLVCLFRVPGGDWMTTSDFLKTFWTQLAVSSEIDLLDAKMMVEDMVRIRYEDDIRYLQEMLGEFNEPGED